MSTLDLATVLREERRLMNGFAPYYHESLHINSYYYRQERRRFLEWMRHTLRVDGRTPETLSVLNVGCATGDVLEWLSEEGFSRLSGLDHAERMTETAAQRVPRARFITDTIEEHDFGGGQFDVIIAAFTLHHMFNPRAFFEMVDRILAPDGRFFILEYNAAGWVNRRWGRLSFHGIVWPLRRLIKYKNRHELVERGHADATIAFNPAHRLLTYPQILSAMPNRMAYQLIQHTRGALLPSFNYALVESSVIDRGLYRTLDLVDRLVEPFGAGNLQWIAGHRNGTGRL